MNDPLHADDVSPDEAPPRLPEWLERKLEARRSMRAMEAPKRDATTAEARTSVDDPAATCPTANEHDAFTRTTAEASRARAGGVERTTEMSTLTFPVTELAMPMHAPSWIAPACALAGEAEPRVAIGFRRMLVGAGGPIVFRTTDGVDVLPKCAPVQGHGPVQASAFPFPPTCDVARAMPPERTATHALPAPTRPQTPLASNGDRAPKGVRRVGLHLLPWAIAVAMFTFVGALKYLDERGLETNLRGAFRAFTTSLVVQARP